MSVKPIPEGYHSLTPFLMVTGVAELLPFLGRAFGAEETERLTMPDGTVRHAEVRIGDSMVMLGEACGEKGPVPGMLYLYVEDVDAVYAQAMEAGAKSIAEPADQFFGDRSGGVVDPSGNTWWLATHIEDLSREEIERRVAEMGAGDGSS